MKKILLINASYQNAACVDILEKIQQNFWLDYSTEILSLRDYPIEQCMGCMHCFNHSGCIIEDKFHILKDKVEDSDFVVICTPTYFYNVSGLLKTFIDRTRSMLKSSSLKDKKIIYIYCTYHSTDTVKSYLDTALTGFNHSHHIHILGSYAVSISTSLDLVDEDETSLVVKQVSNKIADNI